MDTTNALPRGIRNNNPGNIRRTQLSWQGMCAEQGDSEFTQFTTMAYGVRAMAYLLHDYQTIHHLWTIRQLIARWAPSSENDTLNYAETVAKLSGFGIDETLNVSRYEAMHDVVKAMIQVECGCAIKEDDLNEGIAMAMLMFADQDRAGRQAQAKVSAAAKALLTQPS